MKILILIFLILTACEEKGVDAHSRHGRSAHHVHLAAQPSVVDTIKQRHVADWESFLASGKMLNGASQEDFYSLLQALLDGVFDPNTVLTAKEIERIGRANCTAAPDDKTIGERRFERTLIMAPELLTMRDFRGLGLWDWLYNLKRNDLLQAIR
jgi:hypothetical protein